MRIAIALIVITDLSIRLTDLKAFYTSSGIWPSYLITNFGWNKGYWSLHMLSDTFVFELVLFSLHFICAFSLLLGYKSRISTLLTWLLYISLHNRNIYVLQGGDDLLRLILFWGIFLNWGSHYSLDAKKKGFYSKQTVVSNLGYLLLIASVYFFSALQKTSDDWIKNFDAVYYALSLEQIRLPLGDLLFQFPFFLKMLTVIVYGIEICAPILIFWPQKKGHLRLIALILLLGLHIGIGMNLFVGLFFLIGIASLIGLIPSFLIDRLEKMFRINSPIFQNEATSKLWNFSIRLFLILIISVCLLINLGSLPYNPYQLKSTLLLPVNALRLNQNWAMFAPGVLRNDGWFVYHGKDSIGRQWDLRLNQDYVDYLKPQHIVQMYKNDRWRKLAENLQNNNYTFLRSLYCKYILKEWNLSHPEKKIFSLDLYFMEKINQANYKQSIPEKKLHCSCYAY